MQRYTDRLSASQTELQQRMSTIEPLQSAAAKSSVDFRPGEKCRKVLQQIALPLRPHRPLLRRKRKLEVFLLVTVQCVVCKRVYSMDNRSDKLSVWVPVWGFSPQQKQHGGEWMAISQSERATHISHQPIKFLAPQKTFSPDVALIDISATCQLILTSSFCWLSLMKKGYDIPK